MENKQLDLYLEKARNSLDKRLNAYFEMCRTLDDTKQLSIFEDIELNIEKIKIPKSLVNELTKDAVKRLLK